MFTVSKVEKRGAFYDVTLAEYPLLGKAVCSRISNGKLQLDADLVFARFMGGGRRGTPYVGAWITADGEPPRMIDAATEHGLLTPAKKIGNIQSYVKKTVSIWLFGPGDNIEIAAVKEK